MPRTGYAIALTVFVLNAAPSASAQTGPALSGAANAPTRVGTAASGVIARFLVHDGDQVQAGQLRLALDC